MTENEISKMVFDLAKNVHKEVGPGLLESCYQAALAYELRQKGVYVEVEKHIPFYYDNKDMGLGFRADIMIEKKVVIELKAVEAMHPVFMSQMITYLKLTDCKLGLLINFNSVLLKDGFKRVILGQIQP